MRCRKKVFKILTSFCSYVVEKVKCLSWLENLNIIFKYPFRFHKLITSVASDILTQIFLSLPIFYKSPKIKNRILKCEICKKKKTIYKKKHFHARIHEAM